MRAPATRATTDCALAIGVHGEPPTLLLSIYARTRQRLPVPRSEERLHGGKLAVSHEKSDILSPVKTRLAEASRREEEVCQLREADSQRRAELRLLQRPAACTRFLRRRRASGRGRARAKQVGDPRRHLGVGRPVRRGAGQPRRAHAGRAAHRRPRAPRDDEAPKETKDTNGSRRSSATRGGAGRRTPPSRAARAARAKPTASRGPSERRRAKSRRGRPGKCSAARSWASGGAFMILLFLLPWHGATSWQLLETLSGADFVRQLFYLAGGLVLVATAMLPLPFAFRAGVGAGVAALPVLLGARGVLDGWRGVVAALAVVGLPATHLLRSRASRRWPARASPRQAGRGAPARPQRRRQRRHSGTYPARQRQDGGGHQHQAASNTQLAHRRWRPRASPAAARKWRHAAAAGTTES